jgi:hypothetical protein
LKLAKENKPLAAIPPFSQERKLKTHGSGFDTEPILTKARKWLRVMDFTANTGSPIYAGGDGVAPLTIPHQVMVIT